MKGSTFALFRSSGIGMRTSEKRVTGACQSDMTVRVRQILKRKCLISYDWQQLSKRFTLIKWAYDLGGQTNKSLMMTLNKLMHISKKFQDIEILPK